MERQRTNCDLDEPGPESGLDPRSPEVRRVLEEAMREHYTGWVDLEIPSLGGKTPRQAVKTAEGRARVEALLKGAEYASPTRDPGFRLDLGYVREILGLSRALPQPPLSRRD